MMIVNGRSRVLYLACREAEIQRHIDDTWAARDRLQDQRNATRRHR